MELLAVGLAIGYVLFSSKAGGNPGVAGAAVSTPAAVPPGAMPITNNTSADATAGNTGIMPPGFQQPGSDTIGDPATGYGKGGGNGGYGGSGMGLPGGQTPTTAPQGTVRGLQNYFPVLIGSNAAGGAGLGAPPNNTVDPTGGTDTSGYLIGRGY